ncbi:hypothetical protein [Saccharopolyspora pogona]|uniref:hypothetical protein n=1 Tax=Saccharopolyspora pogona TaxID=333966 RepID=UPI001685313D|nr:hypothetical protein [Saccharopolyspora pogona]
MWTGNLNEQPDENEPITLVTEPEPALPTSEEHTTDGECAAALQVACSQATRSPDVLAKVLAALQRI